jgi:hypothetical protein
MTDSDLPPETTKSALLGRNEYGFQISSFPDALANAEAVGYACIGGQVQLRLDVGKEGSGVSPRWRRWCNMRKAGFCHPCALLLLVLSTLPFGNRIHAQSIRGEIVSAPGGTSRLVAQTGGTLQGVTNLNNNFYVSGFPFNGCTVNSITYTTQLECAWWTVKAYAEANSAMVTLYMGHGYYNINASLVLPTQSFTSVSLIGAGYQGSTIVANATMSDAMIYKNETVGGGTLPNATFRDFKMIANDKAQGCMRLWGLQEPVIENVNCDNVPNGAPFLYQFGEPSNYGQGWIFQLMGKNIIGGNSVTNPAKRATVTATLSGGSKGNITGYVVANGGLTGDN